MKNSLLTVFIILLISVLGCVLPNSSTDNERQPPPPVVEKEDSEETEKLKEKIAELEKNKLEDKIDELEKKIDQQKRAPASTTTKSTSSSRPPKGFGRVNSPSDGFLALRSEPSVDRGVRVTTIPHGKTLRVYSCGRRTTVGGRSGRWCQVVWRRDIGYVFDAYLIR